MDNCSQFLLIKKRVFSLISAHAENASSVFPVLGPLIFPWAVIDWVSDHFSTLFRTGQSIHMNATISRKASIRRLFIFLKNNDVREG